MEYRVLLHHLLTRKYFQENLERCYKWFPKLEERANQSAGTLSGGEQQMVAVARALIGMPKLGRPFLKPEDVWRMVRRPLVWPI